MINGAVTRSGIGCGYEKGGTELCTEILDQDIHSVFVVFFVATERDIDHVRDIAHWIKKGIKNATDNGPLRYR